jgi:hypothetical protein
MVGTLRFAHPTDSRISSDSIFKQPTNLNPSYFAQAEYPVRRGSSAPSLTPRNTGSPTFVDDDD